MRHLFIGDWHAKTSDLTDSEALERYVYHTVEAFKPDRIVFLGDQYDTHGIVHVRVHAFWRQFLKNLTNMVDAGQDGVIALIGNHDMPADRVTHAHAMQAHEDDIRVVDWHDVLDGYAYCSYTGGQLEHFAEQMDEEGHDPSKLTLVCHETFQGAQYENGFYAEDGIDAEKLPFKSIISGHIHKPGQYGKVWYPGAPRYFTVSDANITRAIWMVKEDGSRGMYPTDNVVSKVWHLVDTPEASLDEYSVKSLDRVVIDIKGPTAFIEARKKLHAKPGVRIRTFPTDGKASAVTEAEGIGPAFRKYASGYTPPFGTSKERVAELVAERLHV